MNYRKETTMNYRKWTQFDVTLQSLALKLCEEAGEVGKELNLVSPKKVYAVSELLRALTEVDHVLGIADILEQRITRELDRLDG